MNFRKLQNLEKSVYRKRHARCGRIFSGVAALTLGCLILSGCSMTSKLATEIENSLNSKQESESLMDLSAYDDTLNIDQMFTDRELEGGYDASDITESIVLKESDSLVTLSKKGTYVISGTMTNGQLVVDAGDEKVTLVLSNANITNSSSAAIYIKSADKVFLVLEDGSTSTLSTSGQYVNSDDTNIDAVIFSKDDLSISGNGSLSITGTDHGIVSKDDLVITSGTYDITASSHGLVGKDSVRILDGNFTITSGKDAIHGSGENSDSTSESTTSSNEASTVDPQDGFVYIAGGTFQISSEDDGIHANGALHIDGGDINIAKSYEGLEGLTITISDGTVNIEASDDGMNAAGGTMTDNRMPGGNGNSFGNGNRPDMQGNLPNGKKPSMPSDMPDGEKPDMPSDMPDGEKPAMPSDMQNNDNQDNDRQHKSPDAGMGGGGAFGSSEDDWILIEGGTIYVNAAGDGIDSNGNLLITGGTITVSGSERGADSALDWGASGGISGGTVIATGTTEMAESFSSQSTQSFIKQDLSNSVTGLVSLQDENGTTLLTFEPTKSYNCITISCPELKSGKNYTLNYGTESITVTVK